MFPLIEIFGRQIGTYALCGLAGLILSSFFLYSQLKTDGFASEDIVLLALVSALGLTVGGHLLYSLVNFRQTVSAFEALFSGMAFTEISKRFALAFGGSVFYGGLFGAIISIYIHFKRKHSEVSEKAFDAFTVSVPLFHVFGRIGCFLGGCCYGIESNFGFRAVSNPLVPEVCEATRFPVALLESFCNLLIFITLFFLFKKGKRKILPYYFVMYSCVRFLTEFLRGDIVRGIFFGLSTSQWISLLIFVISATVLIFRFIHSRQSNRV